MGFGSFLKKAVKSVGKIVAAPVKITADVAKKTVKEVERTGERIIKDTGRNFNNVVDIHKDVAKVLQIDKAAQFAAQNAGLLGAGLGLPPQVGSALGNIGGGVLNRFFEGAPAAPPQAPSNYMPMLQQPIQQQRAVSQASNGGSNDTQKIMLIGGGLMAVIVLVAVTRK